MQGAIGKPIVQIEIGGGDFDAEERIAGIDGLTHLFVFANHEAIEGIFHDRDALIIDRRNPVDCEIRVTHDLNVADSHCREDRM